jgi:curli biogenesis system outer membrane secretion channel CsgG|tara:strand:+ start:332 stop:1222 length:891 start_codon:yes stop_codon:yes gene_type:complete
MKDNWVRADRQCCTLPLTGLFGLAGKVIRTLVTVGLVTGCVAVDKIDQLTAPNTITDAASEHTEHSKAEVMAQWSQRNGIASVAVTSFEDLTGARVDGGSSTAVAASGHLLLEFILKNYRDEGHLAIYSRRLLSELINERRLAQQANTSYATEAVNSLSKATQALMGNAKIKPLHDLPDLGPVDFLITGAVIGYDKNTRDSGAAAGMVGISNRYQQSEDSVSVLVELINVKTGAMSGIGIASELISSKLFNAGVFKYLEVDKILELEGGGSLNEPKTYALYLALTQAVENMFRDTL